MKTKLKKLSIAFALSLMFLVSASVYVKAEQHTHAYSYMGQEMYQTVDGGTHPYYVYENGQMVTKSCHITYFYYRQVWKCACGSIEYRNPWTVTHHSAPCGS